MSGSTETINISNSNDLNNKAKNFLTVKYVFYLQLIKDETLTTLKYNTLLLRIILYPVCNCVCVHETCENDFCFIKGIIFPESHYFGGRT